MELKGIKGITTFIQNTEPTNPSRGDVWVKPGHVSKKVYSRDKWNRPAWLDMVSGAVYGPGSDYGYSLGGADDENYQTIVERITFPFDSGTASHVGNMSGTRYHNAGCNSSNYGYSLGGTEENGTDARTIIDRITFPFDSGTSTHVGNLSSTRYQNAGCDGIDFVTMFV